MTKIATFLVAVIITCATFYGYFNFSSKKPMENETEPTEPRIDRRKITNETVYIFSENFPSKLQIAFPSSRQIVLYCRFNKIKYEIVSHPDAENKLYGYPFVVFKGEKIADFSKMVRTLDEHFHLPVPNSYKPNVSKSPGKTRNLSMMKPILCDGLSEALVKERFRNPTYRYDLLQKLDLAEMHDFSDFLTEITEQIERNSTKNQWGNDEMTYLQCFGAIRHRLHKGDDFLFGNEITTADIVIYCQLTSFFDVDKTSNVSDLLKEAFPEIVDYLNRVRRVEAKILGKDL